MAGDGSASQQSMVVDQRQPPTDGDAVDNVVLRDTVSPHHRHHRHGPVCYQLATKCPPTTANCDYSPSRAVQPRGDASSQPVDAAVVVGGGHVVIDATPTTPDDLGRRIRRLPTSQITCRILATTPAGRSPADATTGTRKAIMPAAVCNGRPQWTGVVDARTALTDSYSPRQQRPVSAAAYRYRTQNGNS